MKSVLLLSDINLSPMGKLYSHLDQEDDKKISIFLPELQDMNIFLEKSACSMLKILVT